MRNACCASRRFYNAIYRWKLANAILSCRRAFSTTSLRTEIRKHIVQDDGRLHAGQSKSRNPGVRMRSPDVPNQRSRAKASAGSWTKGPVLTSSEKPFDTFKEWEEVIRYRSEAGLLLQIGVPQRALQHLQERFGKGLETLKEKYGARIEIGSPTHNGASEIGSVTLSGGFDQIRSARNAVLGSKGQTLTWDRPRSVAEKPFDSLQPLEIVIRESDPEASYLKVETMVPDEDWMRWIQTLNLELFAQEYGVSIACDVRHEQGRAEEDASFKRQQVLVDGPPEGVKGFLGRMEYEIGFSRAQLRRQQEQKGNSEVPAAQVHYALIEIPKDPESIIRIVAGKRSAGLAEMKHACGVQNIRVPNSTTIRIWAPLKDSVEKAEMFLQNRVNMACEKLDIPAKQVRVLESGLTDPSRESSAKEEQPPSKRIENGHPPPERTEMMQNSTSTVQSTEEAAHKAAHDAAHKATQQAKRDEYVENITRATRLALRAMSHPVVLVTSQFSIDTTHGSFEDAIPFSRGVTVSSFNSITLTPRPMISFNIRVPSRTWDAISSMRRFSAHILNATPKGAALAHAFTLPYDRPDEPFWRAQRMGGKISFERKWKNSPHKSTPTIEMEDAVSAILIAGLQPEKCVRAGDHMIVVAEVSRVHFPGTSVENAAEGPAENATGLTYARQGYRAVGEEINAELAELESPVPVPSAKTPTTDSPALDEAAQTPSPSVEETKDLDASVKTDAASAKGSGASTAEHAEFDYFEAIAKDDDESDSVAPGTQAPLQTEDIKLPAEEEEYNFGFDQIQNENENDRWNNGDVPVLSEEVAEVEGQGPPVADGSESGESGGDRKDESQKKSPPDANTA